MTYDESLAWLYSTQQFGIKLGLDNTRKLLAALGNPQDSGIFFHVAGTNGKGSVCAMLDAILRAHGKRTGLYTSPHLISFHERIRVDGQKISSETVAHGLSAIRKTVEGWEYSPTFFEITTALALRYFADEECDCVVLETGMGGRLDSTNAVTPAVCLITPISFDHTQWLGSTLAEIAAEKAGIIKSGVPIVSARQEAEAAAVLETVAAEKSSSLGFARKPLEGYEIGLAGEHQKENAELALAGLIASGIELREEAVRSGLRDVRWPGRFHKVGDRIILDGGHNPHAAASLVKLWKETYGEEKATIIFGALADKEYLVVRELLEPIAREFFYVPVRSERATAPETLDRGSNVPGRVFSSVSDALNAARGRTLVTGSLFLVGEALEILGIEP